jgi:MFS family permease
MIGFSPAANLRAGIFADRNFRLIWSAATISAFGFYITDVAVPLLAIDRLHASAFEVGLIRVVEQLPALLFGLFLGVLVDRVYKRKLLVLSDVIRSLAMVAIPVAAATGHLHLGIVLAVVFIVGSFNLLFDIADGSFLPIMLGRERLIEGNSRIEASYSLAQLGGPAIGGALVSLITAPYALLVTAITLFTSAGFIRQIDTVEPVPVVPARGSVLSDIRSGLGYLLRHPLMRPVVLAGSGMNLFGFMFLAVYILYMKRDLEISDFQVGMVFAIGGLGSLIGTVMTPRFTETVGVGMTTVLGAVGFGLTGMLVPIVVLVPEYAFPLVVAAEFLQYLCFMPFFLNALTIVQLQSPDHMRGRIMSSRKFLTWGMQPVGSLIGGLLGSVISLPLTLAVSEFGMLAVGIWLATTPIRHLRTIPEMEGAHLNGV